MIGTKNGRLIDEGDGVPGWTMEKRRGASQLVRRKQPWEPVLPMSSGLGVPWMP